MRKKLILLEIKAFDVSLCILVYNLVQSSLVKVNSLINEQVYDSLPPYMLSLKKNNYEI